MDSSFFDFLSTIHPSPRPFGPSPDLAARPLDEGRFRGVWDLPFPQGTTVLAIKSHGGAVIAGDRLATEGHQVADRRIEKVFKTDEHSAIAIAGAAGPCLELVRLFQIELEHYEKLEGMGLSTEGKANKLAQMVRANLPLALQGLIVLPIFVGYDQGRREGRIFKYDLVGGRYEETEFFAIGSGGRDARSTMKKLYRKDLSDADAVAVALEALVDASEEDRATAGPDLLRGIFPTVKIVTDREIVEVDESRIRTLYTTLIARRGG